MSRLTIGCFWNFLLSPWSPSLLFGSEGENTTSGTATVLNTPEDLPGDPASEDGSVLADSLTLREESGQVPGVSDLIPVLLLDDDFAVSRMIQLCLARHGYSVTIAASGIEGIREILKNDFAVILCDMMMPALSGDMFYRAVERIRPSLSTRFIFITGHREDSRTQDFIKNIKGQLLPKPFQPAELLQAVRSAEIGGFFSDAPASPLESQIEAGLTRTSGETGWAPVSGMARPGGETQRLSRTVEGAGVLRWFLLGAALLLLAAIPTAYYFDLKKKVRTSSEQLRSAEELGAKISQQTPDLAKAWGELQAWENALKRLAEEQEQPRWMPALRTVATATPPEIALRSLIAGASTEGTADYKIRLAGVCTADAPRLAVDIFRANLETKMQGLGAATVSARIESLEDKVTGPEPPDSRKVAFSIVVETSAFTASEPGYGDPP